MFARINNYNSQSKTQIITFMLNWNKINASGSILWLVEPEKVAAARTWATETKKWFTHTDNFGTDATWYFVRVVAKQPRVIRPEKDVTKIPVIVQGRKAAKTIIKEVYASEEKVLVQAKDRGNRMLIVELNKELYGNEKNFKFIQFVKEEVK